MVDRRRGWFQSFLQTLTSAMFLLLASLLVYDRWSVENNVASVEALRKELQDVGVKNLYYLEGRINRVAEAADSYQINTNSRITTLENRMKVLEVMRRESSRVVNNNNAISTGNPVVLNNKNN